MRKPLNIITSNALHCLWTILSTKYILRQIDKTVVRGLDRPLVHPPQLDFMVLF